MCGMMVYSASKALEGCIAIPDMVCMLCKTGENSAIIVPGGPSPCTTVVHLFIHKIPQNHAFFITGMAPPWFTCFIISTPGILQACNWTTPFIETADMNKGKTATASRSSLCLSLPYTTARTDTALHSPPQLVCAAAVAGRTIELIVSATIAHGPSCSRNHDNSTMNSSTDHR